MESSRGRRSLFLLALVAFCSPALYSQSAANAAFPERQVPSSTEIPNASSGSLITIPGPLRSLERMAGISQKAEPDEVLPLLARNIFVQGYVGWRDQGHPTEFLILLGRYLNQAQELSQLAGDGGVVHVVNCQEAEPLLHILGYRLRQQCGNANAALITSDQERAFLTTDSGFPLPALEDALRGVKPFSYRYPSTKIPVVFNEKEWTRLVANDRNGKHSLTDAFLHHPMLARLYWAVSKLDAETRDSLRAAPGLGVLLPFAPQLDYYGSHILIRSGHVAVPGGAEANAAWKTLVGASPDQPAEFVQKLLSKDKGWLAAFYDCLARASRNEQQHLTDAHRLQAAYSSFHGSQNVSEAARPAFRLASGLLLLVNRLQWDSEGNPVIPGDVELWKAVLTQKHESSVEHDLRKRAARWTRPDQVLDAMFALSRLEQEHGPLQMFLLFSELNAQRSPDHPLSTETFRILAKHFDEYSDQFLIFSEFPQLDDSSVKTFVEAAEGINRIQNHVLRGNAMGTFQAEVGLWEILARQRQIPDEEINPSFQAMLKPVSSVATATQLFDGGRESLRAILRAAAGKPHLSQSELIELLAGPRPADVEGQRIHEEIAKGIRSVMDGQRLVSLDTLLTLGRGLDDMAHGAAIGKTLLPFAGELQEFQMPRPIFTSAERAEWAAGLYNNRHTDVQMQTDISKVLKGPASHDQIEEARGQLATFFRDTLVGLNYAYYEPPGAQLLRTNPLFVRSHDFSGETVSGVERLWRAPQLFGEGSPAGGGAHLVGSLADLPYVLSEAEQDFIIPENVQALIWRETVPELLTNAIFPRWWNVSRGELHAVALYQRAGEELLSSAAANEDLRSKLMEILGNRMSPARVSRVEEKLANDDEQDAIASVTPVDLVFMTAEYRRQFPQDSNVWGVAGKELAQVAERSPQDVSWDRISRDFGVPHPRP